MTELVKTEGGQRELVRQLVDRRALKELFRAERKHSI